MTLTDRQRQVLTEWAQDGLDVPWYLPSTDARTLDSLRRRGLARCDEIEGAEVFVLTAKGQRVAEEVAA